MTNMTKRKKEKKHHHSPTSIIALAKIQNSRTLKVNIPHDSLITSRLTVSLPEENKLTYIYTCTPGIPYQKRRWHKEGEAYQKDWR